MRKKSKMPTWLESKPVPDGFWRDKGNRFLYMKWLEKTLKFKTSEDWRGVTKEAFQRNRGTGFLACCHGDSPIAAVREYKPELTRCEWLFRSVPQRFWHDPANRKRFLEWMGKELGFETLEDWHQLTGKMISSKQGGRLLNGFYNGSVIRMLRDNFPEYDWMEWKLRSIPTHFWRTEVNRLRYLKWLGEKLGFREIKDFDNLRRADFKYNHGGWLLSEFYGYSVKRAVAEYKRNFKKVED